MAQNILARGLFCIVGLSLISSYSFAGYKLNAMCYLEDKSGAVTQPFNVTAKEVNEDKDDELTRQTNVTIEDTREKFRIASLSKILVTHWAIAKLGPEYRFKTKASLSATAPDKTCNIHLSGDQDIFFGKEMLTSTFNQLDAKAKAQGCDKISQVSYDEKIVIPLLGASSFIFDHRNDSDYRGSDPSRFYGPNRTQDALSYFVKRLTSARIKAAKVGPVNSVSYAEYLKTASVKTYSFKSRPLYMMMREYNAYSSNVPPNILFEKLGGETEYKTFIQNRLGLSDQMIVRNGSGYPIKKKDGTRLDNEVSCNAFVRVVQDLDHMIRAYKGSKEFQMADIMAVGGPNEPNSTLKTLYSGDVYHNTLAAKTGSAEEAITFGGMISTAEGNIYFATYTAPDVYAQPHLGNARKYVRDLVTFFMGRRTLKRFDYDQVGAMLPVDSQAEFVEEITLKNNLNQDDPMKIAVSLACTILTLPLLAFAGSKDKTDLFTSAYEGKVAVVSKALDKGTDINQLNQRGESFVMAAASNGQTKMLKLLISKKADLNLKDKEGKTALYFAITNEQQEAAKQLVEAGADLTNQNEHSDSALILATSINDYDLMKVILKKAPNSINQTNKYGKTPLLEAAKYGNEKTVQILKDAGADLKHKNGDGKTALDIAKKAQNHAVEKLLTPN